MQSRTFSFRAECLEDVERFHSECEQAGLEITWQVNQDEDLPDVDVEFQADETLEKMRNVIRLVEDGHVMLQTLRECTLEKNSLERDYDLY